MQVLEFGCMWIQIFRSAAQDSVEGDREQGGKKQKWAIRLCETSPGRRTLEVAVTGAGEFADGKLENVVIAWMIAQAAARLPCDRYSLPLHLQPFLLHGKS